MANNNKTNQFNDDFSNDLSNSKKYFDKTIKYDIEKLNKSLKEIKNEIKGMIITDDSSVCDSLSFTTPIRLRQDNFSSEIINKLNYSYRGKNLEEGKISFYRELAKRLGCSDFSRILKAKNIFVSDWKSNKINLKNDLLSKYSVVVARDKNIYDTAIKIMN